MKLMEENISTYFNWSGNLQSYPINSDSDQSDYRLYLTDKIYLPPSVLDNLFRQTNENTALPSPLTFKIINSLSAKHTYVGVREFSAPESSVGLPQNIIDQLELTPGSQVSLAFSSLPKGSKVVFQPLENDEAIDDWKALLEHRLHSSYTTLDIGREITVLDPLQSSRSYHLVVKDLKPADAVCVVDTDLDLEVLPFMDNGKPVSRVKDSRPINNVNFIVEESVTIKDASIDTVIKGKLSQWDRNRDLYFSVPPSSAQIFIGIDELNTSDTCFIWSNVNYEPYIYIPKTSSFLDGIKSLFLVIRFMINEFEIKVSYEPEEQSKDINMIARDGYRICENCHQEVSSGSYALHSAFCERNNIICPEGCGKVFDKRTDSMKSHWHCSECLPSMIFGDSKESHDAHIFAVHTSQTCTCGETFKDLKSLAFHKATICPGKLIICQFCHLKLPQGTATAQDQLQGLTAHESYCGSRTTDCEICKRPVRIKELKAHMKLHDQNRLESSAPIACLNVNCPRTVPLEQANQQIGLCSMCFGPLHSTQNDPTGAKLQQRLERRYVIQLTRGCGKPWCTNRYCSTGNIQQKPNNMKETMALCKQLMDGQKEQFHFCVDEIATKRNMFIEMESHDSDYSRPWLARAIQEAKGNEREAKRWLEFNAVKQSEIMVS